MSGTTWLILENGVSVIFWCVLIACIEQSRNIPQYVNMILPLFYAPFIIKWLCVFFGMPLIYAQGIEIGLIGTEIIVGNHLYDKSQEKKKKTK